MPKITSNKSNGIIRWDGDDWLGGLLPHYATSSSTNRILGSGLMASRGIDIFRKPGFIMPGSYPTDATNNSVIDAMIKNGAVSTSKAYLISQGTKLHEFDLTNNTITNGGSWPHTITPHAHSGAVGSDVVVYNIAATPYLFYSWYDNTDWDVGRFDLSATFDDDYMSTVPTGAFGSDATGQGKPHPMIVGDDDILYIGNGRNVASFQGSSTTYNASALDLPQNYIISSFAKTSDYLVIFAYKGVGTSGSTYYRSESTAFFWDYVSASYKYAYPLLGNYVNGGFSYKGTVGCFVQGRSPDIYNNKYSKMLLFDGSEFTPVVDFYDNIPGHGGVNVESDVICWNSSGVLYQWGSPFIGFKGAFNKISEFIGGTTNEGMLKNFGGNTLTGSSGTTTSGGLQQFSSTGYYFQSLWSVPMVSPPFGEFTNGRVTAVKVFWGEAASGGNTFTLSLRTNRAAAATTVVSNLTTVTSPSLTTRYEVDSSGNPLPAFESVNILGSYSSGDSSTAVPPYPEAIELYYENKNF